MLELHGVELASFGSRALAMLIDFAIAGALFLGGLMLFFKIANRYTSMGQDNRHINVELNFFENWYSIVYLVLFFGLSVYLGNGRWAMALRRSNLGSDLCSTSSIQIGERFTTGWRKPL